ncbi:hypothetical protein LRAMOSA05245 [Lichtheimia ramosa]|uniref:HSF-type DNA-binding domain-containing protein n=1 Tax=Lichtheimia ramosa TaxID=688394 RepID=A0A077WZQ8_9FUNG|nr:hypothetical protein LRAMOSA05245 [Lichtheimia ramosa]
MALPENDLYSVNLSFSSSPRSSQFSPTASSPATPYLSSSPQDGYFMGYNPSQNNDMYPQLEPQQQPQRGHQTERRNVSTFISKLYSMVGDKKHQDLICWNNAGTSFLITNSKSFSQQVLPEYFKHGNFSSFVRQLNMYGFRKINKAPRIKRGGMASQEEIWEFSHQKFQRDWPDMLWEIKRKAVESDVLRRETGDMQACFSMVQQSQDNLIEQFRMLQDNFSTMLRGFEDLKKSQMQIQMGIHRLSQLDRYDANSFDEPVTLNSDPLINHPPRPQNAIYVKGEQQNPSVFVTSPSNMYQPFPQQQQQPFYNPQGNCFLDAVNTPLPPSPLSSSSFASENFC